MFFISIIFLTILIPSIQSVKPTTKLTFTPDEKYYTVGGQVDISCELLNPPAGGETAQLWHVDLKNGVRTSVSRKLLYNPPDEALDIFKQNKDKRLQFIQKNKILIRQVHIEDSAKYECDCPDCEDVVVKQEKILQVMKTAEPRWHIEPGWPIQEHAKTTVRCTVDDFYPYVSHKIIRHHHEITDQGKPHPPANNAYPQKFSWEAVLVPTADWHNTTLRCTVTEGNSEHHASKNLEVLFTPRFLKCDEKQHVESTHEKSSINCSYSGNPAPTLVWHRLTDDKVITSDPGITIETRDEHHGKYVSIVTFDREKLVALALITTTTTTKAPNGQADAAASPTITGDNYYQQLLNSGFVAKLMHNNEEKLTQKVQIVGHANQARASTVDSSSTKPIQNLSASIILFSLLIVLRMIQHY